MTLIPNWRAVLTKAWSVRLMILAAVLSGVEVALSFLDPEALGINPGRFAALAGLASAAALVARIWAQPAVTAEVPNEADE